MHSDYFDTKKVTRLQYKIYECNKIILKHFNAEKQKQLRKEKDKISKRSDCKICEDNETQGKICPYPANLKTNIK